MQVDLEVVERNDRAAGFETLDVSFGLFDVHGAYVQPLFHEIIRRFVEAECFFLEELDIVCGGRVFRIIGRDLAVEELPFTAGPLSFEGRDLFIHPLFLVLSDNGNACQGFCPRVEFINEEKFVVRAVKEKIFDRRWFFGPGLFIDFDLSFLNFLGEHGGLRGKAFVDEKYHGGHDKSEYDRRLRDLAVIEAAGTQRDDLIIVVQAAISEQDG